MMVLHTAISWRDGPARRRASASARRASRSSACVLRTLSNASSSAFFSGVLLGDWVIVTAPVVDQCGATPLVMARRAGTVFDRHHLAYETRFQGQEARQ